MIADVVNNVPEGRDYKVYITNSHRLSLEPCIVNDDQFVAYLKAKTDNREWEFLRYELKYRL
jgi:hypothetical protein